MSLCGAEGAEADGDLQEAAHLLHPADHARPHHAARTRGRGLASCPAPAVTTYQEGVLIQTVLKMLLKFSVPAKFFKVYDNVIRE